MAVPGQIKARPGARKSPSAPPHVDRRAIVRRRANIPVNPSGICCTISKHPETRPEVASKCSAGHSARQLKRRMAIERVGLAPVCFNFGDRRTGGGGGLQASLGGPEIAATLILTESSLAICSRPPDCASLGLATKSNAPRASAFNAEYAPFRCGC